MSDCCDSSSSNNNLPKKHICTVDGKVYTGVSRRTVLHHIPTPWKSHMSDTNYYFCSDPDCDVVYFGQDDSIINKSALRTSVRIKEKSDAALICYCFGITMNQAKDNSDIKNFVIQQTKSGIYSYVTSNPSGKCCLKEFK